MRYWRPQHEQSGERLGHIVRHLARCRHGCGRESTEHPTQRQQRTTAAHQARVVRAVGDYVAPRAQHRLLQSDRIHLEVKYVIHHARCSSRSTVFARATASATVDVSFGDGLMGSPRNRIAAMMQAAISNAPVSRCLSTTVSVGEERANVNPSDQPLQSMMWRASKHSRSAESGEGWSREKRERAYPQPPRSLSLLSAAKEHKGGLLDW